MRPIRVFLVGDEAIVLHAIRLGLEPEPDLEIVGHTVSGSDALPGVAETRPDVVLLDAGALGLDELRLLDDLRKRCPQTKVVVLSSVEDAAIALEALRHGARAFLGKGVDPAQVAPLIRQVAEGQLVAPMLAGAERGGPAGLTEREREILEHVTAGRSNREIARRLWLSERTIKYYLTHVYRKLGVKGRAEGTAHRLAGRTSSNS